MYLVGDADRERGLARLRRDYAAGRLSVEELDDRVALVARARTTRELRIALRDLPFGRVESELVPRLLALRSSAVGEAAGRRVARLALAATLLVAWSAASIVLLAALALSQLVTGPSSELAAVFTLVWVAVTWLSWRAWRGGARRTSRARR